MVEDDDSKETVCNDEDWCPLAFDVRVVQRWTLEASDYRIEITKNLTCM